MARSRTFTDYLGRRVHFSAERRQHVLEHPEMAEWVDRLGEVLANPDRVVRSRWNPIAELFYAWKTRTRVGPKYLCAVVMVLPRRAFVVTAYLTDSIKKGELLWPIRRP